jgi:hypothetical protein
VGLPVGVVAVLVGIEVKIGIVRVELLDLADRAVGLLGGIGQNQFGAVGAEDLLALWRRIRGVFPISCSSCVTATAGIHDFLVADWKLLYLRSRQANPGRPKKRVMLR